MSAAIPFDLPRVLPVNWRQLGTSVDGASYACRDGLSVIASVAVEHDSKLWLHVSCSRATRLPSYQDMVRVKELFIGPERTALQVLPPRSKHVNIHPFCLHLWCCLDGDVTPDFTQGSGSL